MSTEAENTLREAIARTDKLLSDPRWQSSVVLKIGAKKLTAIRDDLQATLKKVEEMQEAEDAEANDRTGQRQIFILLHYQGGNDISAWGTLIKSLDRIFQGRPIYGEEAEVRKVIDAKGKEVTEGYVAVWVPEDKVIEQPKDRQLFDRFMQPLLIIQSDAIVIDNIEYFIHANRARHDVKGGNIIH